MSRSAFVTPLSKFILSALAFTLPVEARGQPPFWRDMFAIATTSNSVMGLSHQRCPYMKKAYDAEAISWYASGSVIHNHACWAQNTKVPAAIDFCVFANLKQRPLCFPKAKSGFIDAREFRLPMGAFR